MAKLTIVNIFLLLTLFSGTLFGQEFFNGIFLKSKNGYSVKIDNEKHPFRIINLDQDVKEVCVRLENGDMISANGSIDRKVQTVIIGNIDFVGLRRLIGMWSSSEGIIVNFSSFSDVTFSKSTQMSPYDNQILFNKLETIQYKYSLTYSNKDQWILMLTNENGTQIASLSISGRKMTLDFFDQKTSGTSKTLELVRSSN